MKVSKEEDWIGPLGRSNAFDRLSIQNGPHPLRGRDQVRTKSRSSPTKSVLLDKFSQLLPGTADVKGATFGTFNQNQVDGPKNTCIIPSRYVDMFVSPADHL